MIWFWQQISISEEKENYYTAETILWSQHWTHFRSKRDLKMCVTQASRPVNLSGLTRSSAEQDCAAEALAQRSRMGTSDHHQS